MFLAACFVTIVPFVVVSCRKYPIKPTDAGMSTPEMILNHGYPVETHYITTEDGYILQYHRVPFGFRDKEPKRRPPVLLFHGITLCSVQDFAQGPKKGLGYILADHGYDVWAANARGNQYSKNHTYLDSEKDVQQMYDFSFHEMGYYDVPAAIDYILNITGERSLFYCGNSMGSTVFLAFASTRPEHVKKIKLSVIISPAAFMKHHNDFIGRMSVHADRLWTFIKSQKFWTMDFKYLRQSLVDACKNPIGAEVCADLVAEVTSKEDAEALKPYFPVYLTNFPSETSHKSIIHYLQLAGSGGFHQFNYGKKENLRKYGTITPPSYNLSQITCPTAVYYAQTDFLVSHEGQIKLKKALPNLVYEYVESNRRYNHMSFGAAKDCAERIWTDVLRVMENYKS